MAPGTGPAGTGPSGQASSFGPESLSAALLINLWDSVKARIQSLMYVKNVYMEVSIF